MPLNLYRYQCRINILSFLGLALSLIYSSNSCGVLFGPLSPSLIDILYYCSFLEHILLVCWSLVCYSRSLVQLRIDGNEECLILVVSCTYFLLCLTGCCSLSSSLFLHNFSLCSGSSCKVNILGCSESIVCKNNWKAGSYWCFSITIIVNIGTTILF